MSESRLSISIRSTIKNPICVGRTGGILNIGKDQFVDLHKMLFILIDELASLFGQFKDVEYVNDELIKFQNEILPSIRYESQSNNKIT